MEIRKLLILIVLFCAVSLLVVNLTNEPVQERETERYDDPNLFIQYHQSIRTREGYLKPDYQPGFKMQELSKAKSMSKFRKGGRSQSEDVVEWKERGPANVPGRTRALIVDPDDPTKNIWFAGSASGGVWKTSNGGALWNHITPELPNLAASSLAMAESNHNTIYIGTGEGFGNVGAVTGNGIFKSTDRGQTWSHLTSTTSFNDINRLLIDPTNENIVVAASNDGIYRTTDGGDNWLKVFSDLFIQDIKATPGNFNILYATQNGVGVLKSVNAGISWLPSGTGLSTEGRLEIAISPVNTNRVFVSTEGKLSGTGSDLYISNDAGLTWSLMALTISQKAVDFLGGQGWYDNAIACDPFNANVVYVGGVSLFKVEVGTGSTTVVNYQAEEASTTFMSLVNFNAVYYGGKLEVGAAANASVQVRFGPGLTQHAHCFRVPEGLTSGVPDANYSYVGYINVPFQVWEVDASGNDVRQLMASYRDQDRNLSFNLLPQNTTGSSTQQSREYIFISNVTYDPTTPSPNIAVTGGHTFGRMYFFWPVLAEGATWDPNNLPASQLKLLRNTILALSTTTTTAADVYAEYDGKNRFLQFGQDVHPDQHNIMMIPMSLSTYKILVANDGGLFISNTSATPGINQNDWRMVGNTYNTGQFYGADKRPGKDEYLGGLQDNGTWRSPERQITNAGTNYLLAFGGDGFEVLWNNRNGLQLLGGSQFNAFMRSVNGGNNWEAATGGLSGESPFISRLANSKDNPANTYTVTSAGVFRSNNFGDFWSLTPITQKWGSPATWHVDVSRANSNVVWAGGGMSATRSLHISIDEGQTFNITNNYNAVTLGSISGLATHPTNKNTAYALFSFADAPKILRTNNLGQEWEDISGFGAGSESVNGFPDVAVYCLYVRPDNTNLIWVGTEIGIVESTDNGLTWAIRDDFSNVSVWDMKGQDNQVVIATHGRGIWTATLEEMQSNYQAPKILAAGASPKGKLAIRFSTPMPYNTIQVSSALNFSFFNSYPVGQFEILVDRFDKGDLELIGTTTETFYPSALYPINGMKTLEVRDKYVNYFTSGNTDLYLSDLSSNLPAINGATRPNIQTLHSYNDNSVYELVVRHPIKIGNFPFLYFRDIAIVEPNDFITVDATKNGLDWVSLTTPYNATYNAKWLENYNNGGAVNKDLYVDHQIDLSQQFTAGDSILIRFRLTTNESVNAWGWALDYITIQQEPTGLETTPSGDKSLMLYPNPAIETVHVQYDLSYPSEVGLYVYAPSGKIITSQNLGYHRVGLFSYELSMKNQTPGQYLVILKTAEGDKVGKLFLKN